MPGDEVAVLQLCGKCGSEIGTFSVKRDNLMLTSSDEVWCPRCEANVPEVRDIAGRLAAVQRDVASYPKSKPAESFSKPAARPNG